MAEPNGRARLPRFAKAVARGVHLAVLKDALDALDRAEQAGVPFEETQAQLLARMRADWTAPKAPRLALTTENAAAQAVNLGRVDGLSTPTAVKRRPFWLFCAVLDDRVTETCLDCDGTLLPVGHPWWSTHVPSLHLRCRSSIVSCTAQQADEMGGATKRPPTVDVEDGFGTIGDLCSWEPQPGEYPAELFERVPMRDATNLLDAARTEQVLRDALAGLRTLAARAELQAVPAGHPVLTAPMAGRYSGKLATEWLGWIEDAARAWIGWVDPAGHGIAWMQRDPSGAVVGEPQRFTRPNMATTHACRHALDLGTSDVHVPTTVRPRRLADGYKGIDFTPPKGARDEAERGLAWRREHGRGGTAVGVARARDLARGATLSPSTVRRMASFFARHEVDKEGKGWSPGEDGFPSNGRIAWALWGGDPGRAWATKVVKQMNARTASEGTARTMAINTPPRLAKKRKSMIARPIKGKPVKRATDGVKQAVGFVRRRGLHFRIGLALNGEHQIEVMHAKAPVGDDSPFIMRELGCPLELTAATKVWNDLADAETRAAATPAGITVDPALTEQLLALRELAAKPVWIQLAKVGAWKGHPAGPFEMTPQTFAEVVRNFNETQNRRIPIDFEHASEAPGDSGSIPADGAPAQGWIVDLDNRGNAGLWGLVEWLEPARTYIREGKYRFFSPAIRFGSRDRVTGKPIGARMTSGALTNIPFLDGLVPVAASDRTTGATTMSLDRPMMSHDFMARMRAALRCGDTDPMEKLAAKCADLRDLCASMDDAMMSQGVNLRPYMTDLAGLMNMPAHSTLGDILEAVEEMIEAAIQRHEATLHPGGSDDEPLSQPTGATMSDTSKDLAVTLGETKQKLEALTVTTTAEKAALMSERDALVTEKASLTLRLREAESAVATEKAAAERAAAEVVTLKAEIAKRDNDALEGTVTVAFETYKDSKKLSDHDKAAMRILLKSDATLFAQLYPPVAPGERHLLQNLTSGRTGSEKTTQMDGKIPVTRVVVTEPRREAQAAPLSVSDVRTLTDKLQKERGMTLVQASLEVDRIVKGQAPNPLAS